MVFETNVKTLNADYTKDFATIDFPSSIEICLTRVPIRVKDGYSKEMMESFATQLKSKMIKNGIVFLICYGPIEDKTRPYEIAVEMVKAGFKHIDTIICEKTWLPGKRTDSNLVNAFDYVFYFCNGNTWSLDRQPLRDYLKTDIDISCPGNVWKIKTGSLDDSYSIDLAYLLIKMTALLPGSLVFEPFMSSRYSLMMALEMGYSFIGYEAKKKKIEEYKKIIKEYEKGRGKKNDL